MALPESCAAVIEPSWHDNMMARQFPGGGDSLHTARAVQQLSTPSESRRFLHANTPPTASPHVPQQTSALWRRSACGASRPDQSQPRIPYPHERRVVYPHVTDNSAVVQYGKIVLFHHHG